MQGFCRIGVVVAMGIMGMVGVSSSPVNAADLGEPVIADNPWTDMSWMVRGRVIGVIPDENDGRLAGFPVSYGVDDAVMPELDISYFLTDNLALELILAVSPHDVDLVGVGKITDILLLPPTLTFQYHHAFGAFKPYIGAGINYTIVLDSDATPLIGGIDDWSDGVGLALQAGFDYAVDEHWSVNVDVKKLFLNMDARVTGAGLKASVDLDPWIIGAGIGYRF